MLNCQTFPLYYYRDKTERSVPINLNMGLIVLVHVHQFTLWTGIPPIVMPYLRLDSQMLMKSGKQFDRHNLSLIHFQKCAGSSLVVAFRFQE